MPRRLPLFDGHPISFPEAPVYRAVCLYVYDGDTIDVLVDLGFGIYHYVTVRLRGVDAWELTGEERERGLAAKAFVEQLILGKPVKIATYRDRQTFGRYEAEVWYWSAFDLMWFPLAEALREAGHTREA